MKYIGVFALLLLSVAPAAAQDMPLSQVLIDGEGWKPAAKGFKSVHGLAADRDGNVFLTDAENKNVLRLAKEGQTANAFSTVPGSLGLTIGPDGRFYQIDSEGRRIFATDSSGKVQWEKKTAAAPKYLAVAKSGTVYYTAPEEGAVYRIAPEGDEQKVAKDIGRPTGITFWADGGTLVVADAAGKHLYAFRVEKDGSLSDREGYYTLRLPHGSRESGAGGMTLDNAGRLYVATTVGVQCYDPTGRLNGVLLNPGATPPTAVAFGGPEGDQLFIACGDTVYGRKTKAKSVLFPVKK